MNANLTPFLQQRSKLSRFNVASPTEVLNICTLFTQKAFYESRAAKAQLLSHTQSFSTDTSCSSLTFTEYSLSRRMVLYSSSDNQEQSFLPSIADDNSSKRKHKAKSGTKKKYLRQKKQKDVIVHFPELATKNSSKTVARKSSSPKVTFQAQEMLKTRQKEATKPTKLEKRRGNLRLPSLALTSTSEGVTSKPTESWSAALGLRDTYEIPRGLLNKLTDEILKIDRQMREEAKIQRIRENRMISSEWGHSIEPKHSYFEGTFERTSCQGFSYFPCLQKRSVDQSSDSMPPHWAEDKMRERMTRHEAEIGRKLREFKHRHSLLKYKD